MLLVDEDYRVRAALRGDLQGESEVLRADVLCGALHRSHAAVQEAHSLATQIWQSSLSLFDSRAEHAAAEAGVPQWAVSAVQRAKLLVQEAARLGDLVDVYEAKVNIAKREKDVYAGVTRKKVLALLDQLDSLARDLREHLELLQKARKSFNDAKGTRGATTSSGRSSTPETGHCQSPSGALCASPGRSSSSSSMGSNQLPATRGSSSLDEDVEDILWHRRPESGATLWHQLPRMLDTSLSRFTAACTTLRQISRMPLAARDAEVTEQAGAAVQGDAEAQAPTPGWTRTRGQASPWLALTDTAEEQRYRDTLSDKKWFLAHSQDQGAQNRWDRCRRRSDRRWTLP